MKLTALQTVTQLLAPSDKLPALALNYAQQAEKELDKSSTPAQQVSVLKVLASALRKNGKTTEAKELKGRIAKLDVRLDEEFARNAVPFKPEPARRKGDSNRVVLLELFTGVRCPPCVAADAAFDALLQAHKPADVVMLQYHMHIPGPDPLTNKDAEERFQFYHLEGTPSALIDGNEVTGLGGGKQAAKTSYDKLVKSLGDQWESKPAAQLKVSAQQAADKINIQANVSDLKKPGESVRLHVVVVEEVVHFAGNNGQRLHHHVVRAFPGGVKGIALKEASAKQDVSVSIADLRKSLDQYLSDDAHKFDEDNRPLDLKHLKVVAFIQDEATKEVLQAAQADLNESKSETE